MSITVGMPPASGATPGDAPGGAAGGELAGTYPNPTVATTLPHSETIGPANRQMLIGDVAAVDGFTGIQNAAGITYALLQDSTGNLFFNSATGKTISHRVNNVEILSIAATLTSLVGADFAVSTAGKGLLIKEGSNARMGTTTLASGTKTVANTSITANTRIFLSQKNAGAGPTLVAETSRINGTSFTIGNGNALDSTTVVSYLLIEPAA